MTRAERARSRLDWAQAQLAECRLCPRDCRVDRTSGETGWCGADDRAQVFMEFVHYGEEAPLAPSHTFYLTGCNLRCVFCHTAPDRQGRGQALTGERLRALVERGRREGARNVNFLGGEPTVSLPALLRLFAEVRDLPLLVWNSNLYCTADALAALGGLVDVHLADLKFGNAACARRFCGADDYWDVVRARLQELWGRERETLIVRHLVLPGHLDCCTRPALAWLASALGRVRVSLKTDYIVMPAARGAGKLGRFLAAEEIAEAADIAAGLGLELVPQGAPGIALQGETKASASAPVMMSAEVVISPKGAILLRHPTRGLTAAALAATGKHRGNAT